MSFSFRNKFFALVLSILLVVVLRSSRAFAVIINVTESTPKLTRDYEPYDGGAYSALIYMDGNENFRIVLTASDFSGTGVNWSNRKADFDYDKWQEMFPYENSSIDTDELFANTQNRNPVNFSSSGNTYTITGTLNPEVAVIRINVNVTETEDLNTSDWALIIRNSKYFNDNTGGGDSPSPNPQGNNETQELEHAVISPVKLSDDVIEQIAENINVSPDQIKLLTSRDFSTATPPEPTDEMKQKVNNDGYEFIAKLNTINVSEDGWYAFKVTVSDDLVGTKVSDLRLYYAEDGDFTISSASGQARAAFGLMPLINGVTGGLEISNMFGVKLDTLPKQFLATMFLSASKSLTVYIVKILIALLTGCNAGFGLMGAAIGAFLVWKYFKRH